MPRLLPKSVVWSEFILLLILSVAFVSQASAQAPAPTPVVVNFDNVPDGTLISNQFPFTRFSAYQRYPVAVPYSYPGKSYPNYLYTRRCYGTNYWNCYDLNTDGWAPVTVEFTRPVNNLSYTVLGVNGNYNGYSLIFRTDIYQNGNLQGTYDTAVWWSSSVTYLNFTWGHIPNITKIVIHSIRDLDGIGTE